MATDTDKAVYPERLYGPARPHADKAFCSRCDCAPYTRRYSPAEWAGYYVRVCQGCYDYMRAERAGAMR